MSTCMDCGLDKEINLFRSKNICKFCFKVRNTEYIINTRENKTVGDRQYRANNRKNINEKNKKYRDKIKISLGKKNKVIKTKSELLEKKRLYNNQYYKKRVIKDPQYKLRKRITSAINKGLKRKFCNKNGSIKNYLPFTFKELKIHLEFLFEPWMIWDNWGIYNSKTWDDSDSSTWVWNIDHIIPQIKFHYLSMEDDEFKKCWNLSNLRPYSAKQNIIDGDRK